MIGGSPLRRLDKRYGMTSMKGKPVNRRRRPTIEEGKYDGEQTRKRCVMTQGTGITSSFIQWLIVLTARTISEGIDVALESTARLLAGDLRSIAGLPPVDQTLDMRYPAEDEKSEYGQALMLHDTSES